jgi:hypothetical protein
MVKLVARIWGEKWIKENVVGKSDMRPFGKPRNRRKDYVKFYVQGRGNGSVGKIQCGLSQ